MMSTDVNDASVNDFLFYWAVDLVRTSGVAEKIDEWNDEDDTVVVVPYPAEAVLVVMVLLVALGNQIQWKEAAYMVTVRMSDDQLCELGIFDRVNPDDRALLKRHAKYRSENKGVVQRAQTRTYSDLMRSVNSLLAPLDGSPFKGKRRKKHTRGEIKKIRATMTDAHEAKYARLHDVLNLIVGASVPILPENGWAGSIVLDESVIPAARGMSKYAEDRTNPTKAKDDRTHSSADPDARWWGDRDRYFGSTGIYGYGVTIVKTMPMEEHDNVSLAVGVAWHEPTGGSAPYGLKAIDGGQASGAIAPADAPRSRKLRILVTDMGFSNSLAFKPGAHERGFQTIHAYPKDEINKTTDLGRGVVLFRGAPLCVGAHSLIKEYKAIATKGVDAEKRDAKLAKLDELVMVRRGLPQPKLDRRPGRPRKGSTPAAEVKHQITFRCPAAEGRVFCPLAAAADIDDPVTRAAQVAHEEDLARQNGLPFMPSPPTPLDAPEVCQQDSTTYNLTAKEYKRWQVAMVGTAKHDKLGLGGRAIDEAFHGFMKSGAGATFREDRFLIVNGTAIALFTAMVVAVVNQSLIETHDLHTPLTPKDTAA